MSVDNNGVGFDDLVIEQFIKAVEDKNFDRKGKPWQKFVKSGLYMPYKLVKDCHGKITLGSVPKK